MNTREDWPWLWAAMLLSICPTGCVLESEAPSGCAPGDSRAADDGCNTCECTQDGTWACPDQACPAPVCGDETGAECGPIFNVCEWQWRCGDPADTERSMNRMDRSAHSLLAVLAALFAGACGIAFAPIFVRLSELPPTATASSARPPPTRRGSSWKS